MSRAVPVNLTPNGPASGWPVIWTEPATSAWQQTSRWICKRWGVRGDLSGIAGEEAVSPAYQRAEAVSVGCRADLQFGALRNEAERHMADA